MTVEKENQRHGANVKSTGYHDYSFTKEVNETILSSLLFFSTHKKSIFKYSHEIAPL